MPDHRHKQLVDDSNHSKTYCDPWTVHGTCRLPYWTYRKTLCTMGTPRRLTDEISVDWNAAGNFRNATKETTFFLNDARAVGPSLRPGWKNTERSGTFSDEKVQNTTIRERTSFHRVMARSPSLCDRLSGTRRNSKSFVGRHLRRRVCRANNFAT